MHINRHSALLAFLEESGEPSFRYKQLCQAIFKEASLTYPSLTTLPMALREKIVTRFGRDILTLKKVDEQSDLQSTKYLFELRDGKRIESVYMQFQDGLRSLCLSTQVGCTCKCSFCATGGIGFKRNLTSDEIIDQVLYVLKTNRPSNEKQSNTPTNPSGNANAERDTLPPSLHSLTQGAAIDRITIMGMGEALLNPNLFEALTLLTSKHFMGISPYRISVSTVGIVPGILQLTQKFPSITLTFSLHFPFQKEREKWMPMASTYPLSSIFQALDAHAEKTNQKVYLAYLVLEGINDTSEHVEELKKIFKNRKQLRPLYHLNLISFHPIAGQSISPTSKQAALNFQKKLSFFGIPATIRQSFGKSLNAACGQLVAGYQPKK